MVERTGGESALARRTAVTDSLLSLAVDTRLKVTEIMGWARKDASGTPFASREALDRACSFYVPNRVLFLLPAYPSPPKKYPGIFPGVPPIPGIVYIGGLGAISTLRTRLLGMASVYVGAGFDHHVLDFNSPANTSVPSTLSGWPSYGFIAAGHGTKTWSAADSGYLVLSDAAVLGPSSFAMPSPSYRYGAVVVHACFAGYKPWIGLASPMAYTHIWGITATVAGLMPTVPLLPPK